jgi:predicted nucleic acid-binding protein
MQMKVYLDTSVWLDFFENREENGRAAHLLVVLARENSVPLFFSDVHRNDMS